MIKITMDREVFFAELRKDRSNVFGRRLAQAQVDGIEAILASCERHNVADIHHISNILAQVYRETGGYMLGIKETVSPGDINKNPSDATVIKRLDKAFKAGKLPWVRVPYWRDGAFGRGPIQVTHWANYERVGRVIGVPLRSNPDLALDPKVGADIAVVGMVEGLFTARKLSDYSFPACLEDIPEDHPRRIVNGKDGTDPKITSYHWGFQRALVQAGFKAETVVATPAPAAPAAKTNWLDLIVAILNIFRRK